MVEVQVGGNLNSLLEVGKLYADRCDFKIARKYFEDAATQALDKKDYEVYLKSINHLLRIFAEMEKHKEIDEIKEKLQGLVLKEKIKLDARTYYTLGLCSSYKGQHKTALEFLEKSLATALAADDKENICYAINGIAIVYTTLNRYEDALKEIYNLQVFFQVLPLPHLKLSVQILNGHILREMGKHDQALEVFWNCYEEIREQKNLYILFCLLYAMGATYMDLGNKDLAKMYLTLAKKTADPENLIHSVKKIDARLLQLTEQSDQAYDLVYDSTAQMITERRRGKIDFKNQFILLDLLRLFLKTPGEVHTKEEIVEKIWKQSYDPRVHDNKLYVTIKRLRKLIEPEMEKPKYIFRAKNGYYLNKGVKVLLQK